MSASATQILEDLKNGKCTVDQAQTLLAQMKLTELKKVSYKIGPKGGICFYGIRRLPISLYLEELDQIVAIANGDEFKKFIVDNQKSLSTKGKK
jgi:hypothetical protein